MATRYFLWLYERNQMYERRFSELTKKVALNGFSSCFNTVKDFYALVYIETIEYSEGF